MNMYITDIKQINDELPEGRLLMSALSRLTVLADRDKTPNECLALVAHVARHMYPDAENEVADVPYEPSLYEELKTILNKTSRENVSNTPDFILADFMARALELFENATKDREKWYGKGLTIGGVVDLNLDGKCSKNA